MKKSVFGLKENISPTLLLKKESQMTSFSEIIAFLLLFIIIANHSPLKSDKNPKFSFFPQEMRGY
jgi:hypothetical protein